MFTLKFFTGADSRVVEAASYTIQNVLSDDQVTGIGAIVCVYPTLQDNAQFGGGTEFRVGLHAMEREGKPHPGICFVENSTGKTIDKIGPFSTLPQKTASVGALRGQSGRD